MQKFLFISDFDGTLTHKDFYQIIIDKYLKDLGNSLFIDWKNNEIKDIDFLNKIFQAVNKEEDEFFYDILSIPLDDHMKEFIRKIKLNQGDFLILSAGTSYYIEKLLAYHEMHDVKIISNRGEYKNKGLTLMPDKSSQFYSDRYGLDKEKVLLFYKNNYEKVFFAGDSEPDLKAALSSDLVFAKGSLKSLLDKEKHDYVPFENFKQIFDYLKQIEVIL